MRSGRCSPDSGVCALVDGRQIAVFRMADAIYALDNLDPASEANVLSRGILGDVQGELRDRLAALQAPLQPGHGPLPRGCDPSVNVYPARVSAGRDLGAGRAAAGHVPHGERRLVVIGNGMAGMRTVEQLLELAPERYDITVFGAEPHGHYNRVLLTPLLAGAKRTADIMLQPREWYAQHAVTLHSGEPRRQNRPRRRVVTSAAGREQPYDRLLIATGARPNAPAHTRSAACRACWRSASSLTSTRCLRSHAAAARAAIIGGGLLGLEAADALARRGMTVTVVHLLATLMERQLDAAAATLLQASLEARGLKFLMSANTAAITGEERATGRQVRGRQRTWRPISSSWPSASIPTSSSP